ncbi:hypothetical protein HYH03_001062 [Edaphochlamys debaryana]|uniref:Uncharacterized protein n=1 Tax=Edaphochlamys debaryana TaxID=47281 RepID=A0A835YEA0_9CHLO|nr:hypothetical protein HYH03_001062 [Edaphochlamys debaryana]|eukprot:KAG2501255.1 hypothetical protein HYH03_001062 [Edaphochlamys debaryana]
MFNFGEDEDEDREPLAAGLDDEAEEEQEEEQEEEEQEEEQPSYLRAPSVRSAASSEPAGSGLGVGLGSGLGSAQGSVVGSGLGSGFGGGQAGGLGSGLGSAQPSQTDPFAPPVSSNSGLLRPSSRGTAAAVSEDGFGLFGDGAPAASASFSRPPLAPSGEQPPTPSAARGGMQKTPSRPSSLRGVASGMASRPRTPGTGGLSPGQTMMHTDASRSPGPRSPYSPYSAGPKSPYSPGTTAGITGSPLPPNVTASPRHVMIRDGDRTYPTRVLGTGDAFVADMPDGPTLSKEEEETMARSFSATG